MFGVLGFDEGVDNVVLYGVHYEREKLFKGSTVSMFDLRD